MLKKSFAGLLAGICLIAGVPTAPVIAEGSAYTMKVNIDLAGEKKEISPYIYGVNGWNASNVKGVTMFSVRQGGNRYSGYNWETNWSNAGEDWQHSSDTNIADIGNGAGYAVRSLSEMATKYNISYKLATLQMCGYVSADKDGTVTEAEIAPSSRWNKVEFRKDGALSLEPDLTDDKVYMDEYVNYIVQTLGDASSATGIQGYSLDNEPFLWNDTHPRMHPEELTNAELVSKNIELAKVVKELDPKAEVFGPALWGMLPCITAGESGNGFVDADWQAVKNDYDWYLGYYLKQMADAEKEAGTRLLDVVDVHYYAQDCATDEAILQAARSLYDPQYKENSWLQPGFGQYFPFLKTLQASIEKNYPGTKLAVSEYNLGNIASEKNTGKSIVSGIAEAEALGAFAENEVYFATYWGTIPDCPYVASAINLYTNYDGNGAKFGDTLVPTVTEDISKSVAFSAIDGNDTSNVTMVIANKDMTNAENAVITLAGTDTQYKSAVVYAVTQEHTDIQIVEVNNNVSGNTVTVELPPLSMAQVVFSDKASDKDVYEAPDIEVKKTTYKFDELETNANGNPVIPLGDTAHLKEIIINTTAYSSEGSGYGGGGGGLCFDHVVENGTTGSGVWGNKAYGYSLGNNVDNVVVFDDEFTVMAGENESVQISGHVTDKTAELQDWWKYSEKQPDGSDITVTYNSVTLVYEYEGSGQTTTEPATTEPIVTEPATTEAVPTETTAPGDVLYGDVDEDGKVDIVDVIALNKNLMIGTPISDGGRKNADVDNNGTVNELDSLNILKSLVKLITLPC